MPENCKKLLKSLKSRKSHILTSRKEAHFLQTRCEAIIDYDTSICSQWATTKVFFSQIEKSENFDHLISLTEYSVCVCFSVAGEIVE